MNKELVNKNNWKFLVVSLILVIALIFTIQTVQKNQENRSKAAADDSTMNSKTICGSSNDITVLERPVSNLCTSGSVIWIDSVANGGEYKWHCIDESSGRESECSAFLED